MLLVTRPVLFSLGKISFYIPQTTLTMEPYRVRVLNIGDSVISWSSNKLIGRADVYEPTHVLIILGDSYTNIPSQVKKIKLILQI